MTDSMTETTHAVDAHDDDHHDHPSDMFYVKIAAILAFFTAIEVAASVYEEELGDALLIISLTVLMIIKFVMVAAYFMHLKYDTPWFRRVFIAGIVLAMVVYGIFFLSFDFFGLG